jgi:hypothetical protein
MSDLAASNDSYYASNLWSFFLCNKCSSVFCLWQRCFPNTGKQCEEVRSSTYLGSLDSTWSWTREWWGTSSRTHHSYGDAELQFKDIKYWQLTLGSHYQIQSRSHPQSFMTIGATLQLDLPPFGGEGSQKLLRAVIEYALLPCHFGDH